MIKKFKVKPFMAKPVQVDRTPLSRWSEVSLSIPGHAHLVGIAGSGMRSLAEVLLQSGWKVSGSDLATDGLSYLRCLGAAVREGHAASHMPHDSKLVIYSDAIPTDCPELGQARQLGITMLSYFQMLGLMSLGKETLAVAGSHGKSTTTALAAHVLIQAGLDPTVVLGATPIGWHAGGRMGLGNMAIIEACEYRRNFLSLSPAKAIIHQIEPDHFDFYLSERQLHEAFEEFLSKVPADGTIVARHECPAVRRAIKSSNCRVETFGLNPAADWSARGSIWRSGWSSFELYRRRRHVADIRLALPGLHNAINALAAIALAWDCGVAMTDIVRGLGSFRGVRRRLEVVGSWQGVTLVDDYAHHPTEVASALAALREMFPGRRVCCLFQPHQISRTGRLLDEFARSLQNADKVVIGEIFRAREPPAGKQDPTPADLANQVRRLGCDSAVADRPNSVTEFLRTELRPGDVLVTMGAGDIGKVCYELVHRIREGRAAS